MSKIKTGRKDALAIAQFLLVHHSKVSQVSYFQNTQDLKDVARERESLVGMMAGWEKNVRRQLRYR